MKKFVSSLCLKLSGYLFRMAELAFPVANRKNFDAWFAAGGDKSLRLDYDLDENSVVFDVGGYEGQWASDIYSRYNCYIHVFEPVTVFADKIKNRFSRNSKISVHCFGLSDRTERLEMSFKNDGSTHVMPLSSDKVMASLVKAGDFFNENGIGRVDLMKINIEGAEYDLLDHILDSGLMSLIKNLQVQFHDFMPDSAERMKKIQSRLLLTHSITYQYPFVWENWEINDIKRRRGNE